MRGALRVWAALMLFHNAGHQHRGGHRRVSVKDERDLSLVPRNASSRLLAHM